MLPRLYPIVDAANFSTSLELCRFSKELVAGGATLIQYRNKTGSAREILRQTRQLRTLSPEKTRLIMNDRADICLAADFDGVDPRCIVADDVIQRRPLRCFEFFAPLDGEVEGLAKDG